MGTYEIVPTPENYAVWFHYAQGKNLELVTEIQKMIKSGVKFTQAGCDYLYNKYIISHRNQKVLDDTSIAAQKVLQEVLRVVGDFSGEQQNYNKDVDGYIDNISKEINNDSIRDVVKGIVAATTNLKKSGERISQKLEESKKEINSLKKNLQQVTIEAQRDFLTGAFNRKTFEKLFDEHMLRMKEKPSELCLIMIDIDHFKRFNDKFGHLMGDEVLKTVSRTLSESLKGRDIVARFGGEEFVVVLPDTPIEGALKVADMIRHAIADKELKRKDTGETFGVITVSMGVARYRPQVDTLPTLIKRADDALYQAKFQGRNRVVRESN